MKTKTRRRAEPDTLMRKRVSRKIQDGDVSGAVRTLASEDRIAPYTPEVLEALRKKHPQEEPHYIFTLDEIAPEATPVTAEEYHWQSKASQMVLRGGVRQFDPSASQGPAGKNQRPR